MLWKNNRLIKIVVIGCFPTGVVLGPFLPFLPRRFPPGPPGPPGRRNPRITSSGPMSPARVRKDDPLLIC